MKLNIIKMMFALIMSTSVFSNMMLTIKPEYVTTSTDEITITFEIPKEEIEEIESTVEIETVIEENVNEEEITETEPEIIETVEAAEPVEEPIQNDTEEPAQEEIPETVVEEVKQDTPIVTRESNVYVNGISVYITDSVTDSDYNMVINWVAEMPSFLTNHVSSINILDDIEQYNLTNKDATGLTKGSDVYVLADGIANRKKTLYHECGHALDNYGGYSYTSKWENITAAEWGGEGHYEVSRESFSEAIARYYVGTLDKTQSYDAIVNLINTGALGEDDGFKDNYTTLYAKYKAIWIYSGADDFYNPVISTVEIGSSVQAVALNTDGTWYKVDINGQEGYCRADMVSLEA